MTAGDGTGPGGSVQREGETMIELILAGLLLAVACVPVAIVLARWPQTDPLLWGLLVLAGTITGTAALVHVADADAPAKSLVLGLPSIWPAAVRLHLDGLAGLGLAGVGLVTVAAALVGFGWGRQAVGDRRLRPGGAVLPLFAMSVPAGMIVPLAADAWTLGAGMLVLLLAVVVAGPVGMVDATPTGDDEAGDRAIGMGFNRGRCRRRDVRGAAPAGRWHADQRRRIVVPVALIGALAAGGAAGAAIAAGGPAVMGLADLGLDFDLIRSGMLPIEPAATIPAALVVLAGLAGVAVVLIAGARGVPPALDLLGTALGLGLSGIVSIRLLVDLLGPAMLPRQLALIGAVLVAGGAGLALAAGIRSLRAARLSTLIGWSRGGALALVPAAVGLALMLRGYGLTAAAVETVTAVLLGAAVFGLAQGLAGGCAGMVTGVLGTDRFDRLGGVLGRLPVAGAGLILAAVAGLGLPLMAGFVPIWLVLQGGLAALQLPDLWMRMLVVSGGLVFAAGWLLLGMAWLRGIGSACLGPVRTDWPEEPADADGGARLSVLGMIGVLVLLGVLPVAASALIVPVAADLLGAPAQSGAALGGWLIAGTAGGGLLGVGVLAGLAVLAAAVVVHAVWRVQLRRPIRLGLRADAPWADGRGVAPVSAAAPPARSDWHQTVDSGAGDAETPVRQVAASGSLTAYQRPGLATGSARRTGPSRAAAATTAKAAPVKTTPVKAAPAATAAETVSPSENPMSGRKDKPARRPLDPADPLKPQAGIDVSRRSRSASTVAGTAMDAAEPATVNPAMPHASGRSEGVAGGVAGSTAGLAADDARKIGHGG